MLISTYSRYFSRRNHAVLEISTLKYEFITKYPDYSVNQKIFILQVSTSKYEFNFVQILFLILFDGIEL